MPVEDWLMDFLDRHRLRFAPHDWPASGGEEEEAFVELWLKAFRDRSIAETEADDASVALGITPPRFRNDHLPAILEAVKADRLHRAEAAARQREAALPRDRPEPLRLPEGVRSARELWRRMVREIGETGRAGPRDN